MKHVRNILWGLVFVVLGVIVGGNSLEVWNINVFFDGWWTLFLIVPAFIDLFRESRKGGNIFVIIVGVVLLLACRDIISFELVAKLFVPVILVLIGLSVIFRDAIGGKVAREIKKIGKNKSADEHCAIFTGIDVLYNGRVFSGTALTAVFGGIKCDLRGAIIEGDVVINAGSVFGGITVLTDEDVNVKIASTSIFGGASDDRKNDGKVSANTVYINATCVFGGLSVK